MRPSLGSYPCLSLRSTAQPLDARLAVISSSAVFLKWQSGYPEPRIRPHCRLRNRGTEYVRESGIKRMSGVVQRDRCGRALRRATLTTRPCGTTGTSCHCPAPRKPGRSTTAVQLEFNEAFNPKGVQPFFVQGCCAPRAPTQKRHKSKRHRERELVSCGGRGAWLGGRGPADRAVDEGLRKAGGRACHSVYNPYSS